MVTLSETEESESEVDWQVVRPTKRGCSGSPINENYKKLALDNNVSSNTGNNRFDELAKVTNEEDNEIDLDSDQPTTSNQINLPKPPPLFIPNVENVSNMIKDFSKVIPSNEFTYKALKDKQVKIMIKTVESYKNVISLCNKKHIKFHTYQLKTERAFRVVIKNLHYSTPIDEIKDAIELDGHKVRNIMNVRSRITKEPLHLFFLDLEPDENNKSIYNIKHLNRAVVKIEPPRKVEELVQCYRCQQFGHTKAYCSKTFKCVKCGDEHPTAECQKNRETPARCSNCNKDHPANYRGCRVYQKIIRNKRDNFSYPRNSNYNQQDFVNNFSQTNQFENNDNYNNNNNRKSYADAVRTSSNETNSFARLESLIQKQIEQTNNLLNMLTLLVTKLCK